MHERHARPVVHKRSIARYPSVTTSIALLSVTSMSDWSLYFSHAAQTDPDMSVQTDTHTEQHTHKHKNITSLQRRIQQWILGGGVRRIFHWRGQPRAQSKATKASWLPKYATDFTGQGDEQKSDLWDNY